MSNTRLIGHYEEFETGERPKPKKKYGEIRLVLWVVRVNYIHGKDCRNNVPISAVGEETSSSNLQIFRVLSVAKTTLPKK